MNHALSMSLELAEQAAWGFRFQVTTRNESKVRLFLPDLNVTELRFGDVQTRRISEWCTDYTVSASGGGFTLAPEESSAVELRVRPCSVASPSRTFDDWVDWDYHRWCVPLKRGTYLVWCERRVDGTYYDLDSHMRIEQLDREAARQRAALWRGQVLSNRFQVVLGNWRSASTWQLGGTRID